MSFKDLIKEDLTIFINPDEFGESHRINGRNLNVVVDDETLEERKNKNFDGISYAEILYYVKADDFGELPSISDNQKFDGRPMFVTSASESNGMYEITLGQNRGE